MRWPRRATARAYRRARSDIDAFREGAARRTVHRRPTSYRTSSREDGSQTRNRGLSVSLRPFLWPAYGQP